VRQELDPADYCFENLEGETRGKKPGQINGQQFSIENCKVRKYIKGCARIVSLRFLEHFPEKQELSVLNTGIFYFLKLDISEIYIKAIINHYSLGQWHDDETFYNIYEALTSLFSIS
jgi:hypothetical protein